MRPIKLVISAFGPYKDKETIDFEKLGSTGLYLISGETGAGKTTIFDAVTYALYGKSSGGVREKNELRSNYADPSTETFVDMTFECKGKTYRIERKPDQSILRPNGKTVSRAGTADFYLIEGGDEKLLASKTRDVDNLAADIIGINYSQFKQIAMISQGDFRDLLKSDSSSLKNKEDIYRRIFKTDLYQEATNALASREIEKKNNLSAAKTEITNLLKRLEADKNSILSFKLSKAQKDEMTAEDLFSLIDEIIDEDKQKEANLNKSIDNNAEELTKNNLMLQKAKDLDKLKEDIEKNENALKLAAAQKNSAEKECAEAEQNKGTIEKINGELADIERCMPKYDALKASSQSLNENRKRLSNLSENISRLQTEITNSEHQLKGINDELETMTSLDSGKITAEHKLDKINDEYRKIQNIINKYKALTHLEEEVKKARRCFLSDQKNAVDYKKESLLVIFDYTAGLKQQLSELEKKSRENDEAIITIKKTYEHLEGFNVEKEKLEQRKRSLIDEEKSVIDLLNRISGCYKLIEELKEYENSFIKCFKEEQKLRDEYNHGEDLRRMNMAGILAEKLSDGKPCPVCGSVHHPNPAVSTQGAPDEKKLKQLKESWDYAAEKARIAENKYNSKKSEKDTTLKLTAQQSQKLFDDINIDQPDPDMFTRLANDRLKEIQNEINNTKKLIESIDKNIEQRNKLKETIAKREAAQKQLTEHIQKISEKALKCEGKAEQKRIEFEKYLGDTVTLLEDAGIDCSAKFTKESVPVFTNMSTGKTSNDVLLAGEKAKYYIGEAEKSYGNVKRLINQYGTNQTILHNDYAEFTHSQWSSSSAEFIFEKELIIKSDLSAVQQELKLIIQKLDRRANLAKQKDNLEQNIRNSETKIADDKTASAACSANIEHLQKSIENLYSELNYESRDKAVNKRQELKKKKSELQSKIEDAEKSLKQANDNLQKLQGAKDKYTEDLKEYEDFSESAKDIFDKIQALESEKKKLENDRLIVSPRIESNNRIKKDLKSSLEKISQLEKEHAVLKQLADTAKGRKHTRPSLENYIQAYYVNKILHYANKRLRLMSRGQYELKIHNEDENESSLELDIKDYHDSSAKNTRPVSTLSGGESFMASLSLALGLSDEIMMTSGGIQLDTMFVDEGFGSLDEETLQMAMNSLESITQGNRLVGIISHVSQLKSRIDKQIIIEKDNSGGRKINIIF